MWYYVERVDGNNITIKNPYEEKTVPIKTLKSSKDIIIGYNRKEDVAIAKGIDDVYFFFTAYYKLLGKPVDFSTGLFSTDLYTDLQFSLRVENEIIEIEISDTNINKGIATCGIINYTKICDEIKNLVMLLNCRAMISITYNLTGRTKKLIGSWNREVLPYPFVVVSVQFTNKDLSEYIYINAPFAFQTAFDISSFQEDFLSGSSFYVTNGHNLYENLQFRMKCIDLTDLKFNPDVTLESICFGTPVQIKLPNNLRVTEEFEGVMETDKNYRSDVNEITAKNFYTEKVCRISELSKGRYSKVEFLWVSGLFFDSPLQDIVNYDFNFTALLPASVDKSSTLREMCYNKAGSKLSSRVCVLFSSVFLDSVYEFMSRHKDFYDTLELYIEDGQFVVENNTGREGYDNCTGLNSYSFYVYGECYDAYFDTIFGDEVTKTIKVFRKMNIFKYTSLEFDTDYIKNNSPDKLRVVLLFVLYAFSYIQENGEDVMNIIHSNVSIPKIDSFS